MLKIKSNLLNKYRYLIGARRPKHKSAVSHGPGKLGPQRDRRLRVKRLILLNIQKWKLHASILCVLPPNIQARHIHTDPISRASSPVAPKRLPYVALRSWQHGYMHDSMLGSAFTQETNDLRTCGCYFDTSRIDHSLRIMCLRMSKFILSRYS